jgi:5-methylcytosine-specific restriction endonuclease McrA
MLLLTTFLRDDPGTPLGTGMPSGRPLRLDGERHYDAWLRLARQDPCAYCGGPGGTVDHVEPRSRPVRGIGGTAHTWLNVVGACAACNGAKRDRPLLRFLHGRRRAPRR